ncbi:hypothetical protein [Corynebacterium phocae]|uniref:hypothetical protein n=1 Tax=Corynebacterium phocae TaxID=161895 RepID=UPI0009511FAC|nr:hypothetical protein [Corynebacterium phocae]KAA8726400.1 hypothetical protein F4V58_02465 [Corynebacterium phocae]
MAENINGGYKNEAIKNKEWEGEFEVEVATPQWGHDGMKFAFMRHWATALHWKLRPNIAAKTSFLK